MREFILTICILSAIFATELKANLGEGCVKVWEHCNFQGKSCTFCNQEVAFTGPNFQDNISSIRFGHNTKLIIFIDENFGGRSHQFLSTVSCLNNSGNSQLRQFADKISSLKVAKYAL